MAYSKYTYIPLNWANKSESLTTPIGKNNLNRIESAIYNIAENLDVVHSEMDAGKFDEANADKVIVGMPTWNSKTGMLTFHFYDGTTFQVDFNVEKIPVSFTMNSVGVITMTTTDGTKWEADIGDVIPTYTYQDSDTIAFSDTKDGEHGHLVSATIKRNSITGDYLQPDYLTDVTKQATVAEASAKAAGDYANNAEFDAKMAQSFAVGGTGIREGEASDSARFYKEEAEKAAKVAGDCLASMQDVQVTGVKGNEETSYRTGDVNITPEDIGLGQVDNTADADKNVASATKLTTSRIIDGISFDGTGAVSHYGTCSTAAGTAAKTVSLSNFTLVTGAVVRVKFSYTNTAATPTLNVNNTGAKTIRYNNTGLTSDTAGYLRNGRIYEFVYDGTYWRIIGDLGCLMLTGGTLTGGLGVNSFIYSEGNFTCNNTHQISYSSKQFIKIGNLVIFNIYFNIKLLEATANFVIATISDSIYFPNKDIVHSMTLNNGEYAKVFIRNNGSIQLLLRTTLPIGTSLEIILNTVYFTN